MFKAALCATTLLVAGMSAVKAQIISIRTVPVSQAHQFAIFPSRTTGMGGVSIAVPDSLLDPFINPGMGARLSSTRFFGSPSAFTVTSNAGGGRTLPVGALTRGVNWYGGLWLALQEVDLTPRPGLTPALIDLCLNCDGVDGPIEPGPDERSQGNSYAFGLIGKELKPGLSLGASVTYSRLNAIDGVDLLYAGSTSIDQFGHALDLRLGLVREWPGERTLEAIALHNRFGTTHNVFYLDPFWNPGPQQFTQRLRLEQNLDRTRLWGLHLEYEQPISPGGWRAGGLVTVNRMDHPKIPNYEIMNIPRDPGHSSAFNFGVGLSRVYAGTTFGLDLIFEPIWSHTWADAAEPVEAADGRIIPAGGMTIENEFRFVNGQARLGLSQEFALNNTGTMGGFQLGLALRSVHYWMDQTNHVLITSRDHEERWTERTPTWGLSLRFPELEVRYQGTITRGTGRPGVAQNNMRFLAGDVAALSSNILVAPSGPLTLDEVRVSTHQVSVSLPIR